MEQKAKLSHASRSGEAQEIIGRMPPWMIRWGITVIAIIFVGTLIGSYFFKCPDIIPARVTITSAYPYTRLTAHDNFYISKLFTTNNNTVKAGQALCCFATTADPAHVARINALCKKIDSTSDLKTIIQGDYMPARLNLGELQSSYNLLLQAMQQYRFFLQHINELQTNIALLTEENNLQQKVRQSASAFNSAQEQWEQTFILRTPIAGRVVFSKFWKENQQVHKGELMMIVAPMTQQYVVSGEIGIRGAGKVKAGQKVSIKLPAYPYEEFGSLTGVVQSRATFALDSSFAIEIKLDKQLNTNAGSALPWAPRFDGIAEIITENKSLLQRLFDNSIRKR